MRKRPWRVDVTENGKKRFWGYFVTEERAIQEYDKYVEDHPTVDKNGMEAEEEEEVSSSPIPMLRLEGD